jgi:2'-5' RNA ligase
MSALWVPVTPEVEARIAGWRQKYDPSVELYPAHISLVYGAFVPLEVWPVVKDRLLSLLGQFSPFEIRLRETGVFEGDPCTLWLKPEDDGQLQRLRAALEKELPEWVHPLPFPFQPHLTIGFFTHKEGLEKVQNRFRQAFSPISFEVDQLDFIYRKEKLVREALPLGKQEGGDRGLIH